MKMMELEFVVKMMELEIVMKVTISESNPDIGLLTQRTFCLSPYVLATASKMARMTMFVDSDWGEAITEIKMAAIRETRGKCESKVALFVAFFFFDCITKSTSRIRQRFFLHIMMLR